MRRNHSAITGLLSSFGIGALPHHLLSQCMYEATRCKYPFWKNCLIKNFLRHYQVDLSEAQCQDINDYVDFNAFFTRALRPDARHFELGENTITCPADGSLSAFGRIAQGQLLQAKGKHYSLTALLAGATKLADQFAGGQYLTIYLSPRDYHRVHMPVGGRLTQMLHVPGRLYSVNASSAASVNQLFARNERVISVFDTHLGAVAVILVGALFVGTIEQVWAGQVAPAGNGEIRHFDYNHEPPIQLLQGAEMGRFNMGSTVVLLLENQTLDWHRNLKSGQTLRLGQALAHT